MAKPPKETTKPLTVQEMASAGGKARAKALTRKRRREIAENAAAARWPKKEPAK